MEELRIKCPSCGIVLDVRNSKNEAVKRITCPNCKKQLAINFQKNPQAAQFVEIKMVQLADGSHKTIVRALTDDHVVKVNGERLQKDDEVVLAPEDKLEIDGEEGKAPLAKVDNNSPKDMRLTPTTSSKSNNWPIYIACIAVLAGSLLWWKQSSSDTSSEELIPQVVDSVMAAPSPKANQVTPTTKRAKQESKKGKELSSQPVSEQQSTKTSIANMNSYELERLAMDGDIDAQYQLGKRWVSKRDSINVVKGIKYLKLAAQNGSSEARATLNSVFTALQQSAANGSTTARNILREQR